MITMKRRAAHLLHRNVSPAFTLVEVMVVVAVIVILATIVVVSYGNWHEKSVKTKMESDLTSLRSAMEDQRNFENKYKPSIPSAFTPSAGNVVQLFGVTDTFYCANIYNDEVPNVSLSYDSASRNFRDYPCSGMPSGSAVGGTAPNAPRGTNLAGDFTNWQLTGTATVSNGILTLGSNGNAKSPLIQVNTPRAMSLGGDFKASQQSPYTSFQPKPGYHISIYYYGADGTTAVLNSAGYTSNGCAQSFTAGSWQSGLSGCNFNGGSNVIYVRFTYWSVASGYASSDLQVRNPLLVTTD